MATPRKHWFRVADSVLTEPWDNDLLAAHTRLSAYLNTRWARDGRSSEEAHCVVCSPTILEQLTGCRSLARARRTIHRLAVHVSLTVDEQGMNTVVSWPKWVIFQKLQSESRAEVESHRVRALPSPLPLPQDAPARRKKEREEPSAAPQDLSLAVSPSAPPETEQEKKPLEKKSGSGGHSLMPSRLSPDQVERLQRLAGPLGLSKGQLRYAVQRVREWSHGNGKARKDWVLVVVGAIRDGWALKGYKPTNGAADYVPQSSPGWDLPAPVGDVVDSLLKEIH